MFIEITNPTNPLRIENILRPYKRGEQAFSPEIAKQILSMTNHPKNIRDMLNLIADLSPTEQAKYNDIVLSAFDHRKQPDDTTVLAQKLSITNGYECELNTLLNFDPFTAAESCVLYTSASHQKNYICADNIFKHREPLEYHTIYFTNNNISIWCSDLTSYNALRFKEKSHVSFDTCTFPPKEINLSMCNKISALDIDFSRCPAVKLKNGSKILLTRCKLSPNFDFSMCDEVKLADIKFSPKTHLKLKTDSSLYLCNCQNLPENLDLSMCNYVYLHYNPPETLKNIKFKEGGKVKLEGIKNFPEELDFSLCDEVILNYNDFSALKNIKFKEGSTIKIVCCENIPENLDVSMCKEVIISDTNLSLVPSLKFKNDSSVSLINCNTLPKKLDVSNCRKISLKDSEVSPYGHIKFKNKLQQAESGLTFFSDWEGKLTYTDYTLSAFLKRTFSR